VIVVLMGVSGSGKTTVGRELAASLGWTFLDADDFHPAANVAKMSRGEPLTDEDRRPWLDSLRERIDLAHGRGEDAVLACSALKHAYRDYLRADEPAQVRYVYLEGSEELIRERLAKRRGHFMPPGLLHSQFEALEPPADAVRIDVTPAPDVIAGKIRAALGLRVRGSGSKK
jgi:gluconokinase